MNVSRSGENRVIIFIIAHYKFYNVYYKIDYKT